MNDDAEVDPQNIRTIPARIGICLLNLITPGLGLIRLSRWQAGCIALCISLLGIAMLFGIFAWGGELHVSGYLAAIGALSALTLLNLCVTVWLSWRWSMGPVSHPYWYSRWYAILGLWLALQVALWPLPDGIRSYYHPYYAPSVSMAPSIEKNDRFVVHMREFDPVKRGDVVIVTARDQEYVKRVAGVPGDRISMRGGIVILNGAPMPQAKIGDEMRSLDGEAPEPFTRLREQFPGEARPHEILDSGPEQFDDMVEIQLGPNQYFLLGDNRDHSADSRHGDEFMGLGVVDHKRIIGHVLFRVWRSGLAPAPL